MTKRTPETSERLPRTMQNSTQEALDGAFQYECRGPELNGASSDKYGAESGAVSTYNNTKQILYYFYIKKLSNRVQPLKACSIQLYNLVLHILVVG